MWFPPAPMSDEWVIPEGQGHKFLVKYMLASQKKTYGSDILTQFSRTIITRNMKLLCQKYPEDDLKRAIAQACLVSDYPFSTKFIEEQVLCLQAIRSCPIAQFYQNKS